MPTMDATRDFGPSTLPTMSELDRDLLHPGAKVGGCQVVEPIAQDDGGILYVVDDALLQRQVLVREHFPHGLAARGEGGEVVLVNGSDPSARETALARFLRGARWLTRFDHPSLGRALRVWEERGTAYLMMPLYEGETFAAAQRHGFIPDETRLRALLGSLCDALAPLHAAGVFHLGLSPDSIWIQPDGRPVLFDLSCAAPADQRTVSDSLDRTFAPIELFGHGSALPVGPWTDIYSLGAVVHHALLGRPPLSAAVLGPADVHAPLSEGLSRRAPGRPAASPPSTAFLTAIDRALSVKPENRPQDLAAFRRLLGLEAAEVIQPPAVAMPPPAPVTPAARPEPPVLTSMPPQPAPRPVTPAAPVPIPVRAQGPVAPPGMNSTPAPAAPASAPETEVDAAAAAAIAMAVSSLPWANEREPSLSAEPPGFSPSAPGALPGRNVPREPTLGPQKFVMPGPAKRKKPARSQGPGRLAAAAFGLLACIGMSGWYVVEHPEQVAAWLGVPPSNEQVAAARPPAATTPTAPVEAELAASAPAAGADDVAAPASAPLAPPQDAVPPPPSPALSPTPAPIPAPSPALAPPLAQAPAAGPVAEPVVSAGSAPRADRRSGRQPLVAAATPVEEGGEAPPPTNPKAACGTRANFALFRCMEVQCGLQRFSRHPQCIAFRADNQ